MANRKKSPPAGPRYMGGEFKLVLRMGLRLVLPALVANWSKTCPQGDRPTGRGHDFIGPTGPTSNLGTVDQLAQNSTFGGQLARKGAVPYKANWSNTSLPGSGGVTWHEKYIQGPVVYIFTVFLAAESRNQ